MAVRAVKAELPEKLYYRIGEVAEIVGVKPYVLRYWEGEFNVVKPSKTRSKHRLYRRRDVEALLQIKRLLHDERFTIEGARKQLKSIQKEERTPLQPELPLLDYSYRGVLAEVKRELEALQQMLR